jgi:pescadillo protein
MGSKKAARKGGKNKNPKGARKAKGKMVKLRGDSIHGQRAGKKGEAAAYITRAQALAKLQVSLADFRRLCILKGIYPRDPKKKSAGMDKTYYHHKDILFLAHEPLLNKFFELKTFMKKFKRLMGRNEFSLASSLEERKPEYTLSHLVRERYPSFDDAVRDLDDAISMLALFASLSADQRREIPADAISEATRLYQEFQLYVIRARALRKVFASIKGYYFQAEICGHLVTWLAPHQYAQDLPPEVDFRVMLTFLDFYRAVAKFINFKLYADLGMAYPPKRIMEKDESSAEVAALEVEMRDAGKEISEKVQQEENENEGMAAEVAADFGEQSKEAMEMKHQLEMANRMKKVFKGLRVFINREVPLRPIYFTLLCGGASDVGWERGATAGGSSGSGSAFSIGNKTITHHVVDRPADQLEKRTGREYLQPQWVFDSFNTGCLLLVGPYAPGRAPPPHLSPFVDDKAEGYVPRQREILDAFAAEIGGVTSAPSATGNATGSSAAASTQETFTSFADELKAEASGVWHSDFAEEKKKAALERATKAQEAATAGVVVSEAPADDMVGVPAPRPSEDEEERLRAKALMPKKHKRLLQRIEKSAKKKGDSNESLMKKRKQIETSRSAA